MMKCDDLGLEMGGIDEARGRGDGEMDIPTIIAGMRNQSIFRRTFASIRGSISWACSPTRLIARSLSVDAAVKAVSASW